MNDDKWRDAESELERLVFKPARAGLGEEIVARGLEARRRAALSSGWRGAAAASLVLAFFSLLADDAVSRKQARYLTALIGGTGDLQTAGDTADSLWAELGPDLGDIYRSRIQERALSRSSGRDGSGRPLLEARERLKGMMDHEIPESLN